MRTPAERTSGWATRRPRSLAFAMLCAVSWPLATTNVAHAQAELAGTVFATGSPQVGIAGALVEVPSAGVRTVADSSGRFRLRTVPPGAHRITVSAVGFAPDTSFVVFEDRVTLFRDFVLRPSVTTLDEVRVEGEEEPAIPAKLAGFAARRRQGIGSFMDRAAIEKFENRRTGDLLTTLPGVDVRFGNSKAWASSGRAIGVGRGAMQRPREGEGLDPADVAAGARPACYMDIYLDGALVYNSARFSTGRPPPLFNVNSIPPENIEAVEAYTSAAQIPAQYNKTGGGCGVLLIWTRIR